MAEIEAGYSGWLGVADLPTDYGVDYATMHDRVNGDSVTENAGIAGQYYSDAGGGFWYFDVYRAGVNFDLSAESGTILSATLSLYGVVDDSDTDFDLTIVSGDDLGDTYVVADYGDLLDDTTSYGILDTSGWVLEDWNVISLNAGGISYLQTKLGGTARLGLRSSRDISTTSPKLNGAADYYESVSWYGHNIAGKKPKLTITYISFVPRVIIID